ncbi:MAG TPA: hypothetical protein VFR75_04660 [Solirubrobacterales bacterium]|nr:hypothetical protein [Solirubrobacterales bacterium]
MPFEAKPLRVQLNCAGGTVAHLSPHLTPCMALHSLPPTLCRIPSLPDCMPLSDPFRPFTPDEWIVIGQDQDDPTSIVIGLDDLPTYIDALDTELRHIETMAERREELVTRLEEARAVLRDVEERTGGATAAEGEQAEA